MGILSEETPEETAAIEKDMAVSAEQPFDINALLSDQARAPAEPAPPNEEQAPAKETAAEPAEKRAAAKPKEDGHEERQTVQEEPAWIKLLPEPQQNEARKHLKGIRGELARRRDAEHKAREKAEHQMTELHRKVDDYIARQEKAKTEPPPPDPEIDPLAYAKHKEAETATYKEQLKTVETMTVEQQKYDEQVKSILTYAQEVEQEFREEMPDYDDAVAFGRETYIRQMTDMGHNAKTAEAELRMLLLRQAALMQQDGGNFAKWVYAQAKQLGYKAATAAAEQPAGKKGGSNAAAQSIVKGQQAGKSLGKNGKTVNSELTWDSLSGMEGEEFDRAFEALSEKETGRSNRLLG